MRIDVILPLCCGYYGSGEGGWGWCKEIRIVGGSEVGAVRTGPHNARLKTLPVIGMKNREVPGDKRSVGRSPHYLLLQPVEGILTLSIQSWHIDPEKSKQAVSLVFDSRCFAMGRPGHALRDTHLRNVLLEP